MFAEETQPLRKSCGSKFSKQREGLLFRNVWVSIKFLSAKFGFTPPPKGPKMRKNCTNQKKILEIDTFSGGGETQLYGQNDFMDIWAFLTYGNYCVAFCEVLRLFPQA